MGKVIDIKAIEYPLEIPVKPWAEWDAKCKYRTVHNRYADKLKPLLPMYQEKINRLYTAYKEKQQELLDTIPGLEPKLLDGVPELVILLAKIKRLEDKYYTVKQELTGRDLGIFKRGELYGTTYYQDFVGGLETNDGLTTGTAWKTLAKYSEVTIRTAGDILKERANVTEIVAAIINFDEDGTPNAPIEVHGCSSTDDPWSDGSDVKPIVDCNAAAYFFNLAGDDFWRIKRLDARNSTANLFNINTCQTNILIDCILRDSLRGAIVSRASGVYFDGCSLLNNDNENLLLRDYAAGTGGSSVILKTCSFDSGAKVTNYGIDVDGGLSVVECIDCSFGQSVAHATADIRAGYGAIVILRNTVYNTLLINSSSRVRSVIYSEDDKQIFGNQYSLCGSGTVTKDTTVVRPGGALSSAKMEPGANCGLYTPLTLNNESLIDPVFKVWLPGGAEKTITIYIRSLGVWAAYPTADQLYIEASYLSNAASAARTTIASTAVLSDATTWVPFTVTFTPAREGWVYINLYLGKYEAAKGCYVDVNAIVSEENSPVCYKWSAGRPEQVGNANLPLAADVRSGSGYGTDDLIRTGTLDLPDIGDVEYGVPFDGGTKVGLFVPPDEDDVRDGVLFGDAGEFVGTIVLPVEADVRLGVGYGYGGVEFTGTFVPDYPVEDDVRDGIVYAEGTLDGDLVLPIEANVRLGVGYGADGTEFTGTYAAPPVPVGELWGELQAIQSLTGEIHNE